MIDLTTSTSAGVSEGKTIAETILQTHQPRVQTQSLVTGLRSLSWKPSWQTRSVAVLTADLRGFTPFSESTGEAEVTEFLWQYHTCVDHLLSHWGATLDHRAGDGWMAFLGYAEGANVNSTALDAAELAIEVRAAVRQLLQSWEKRGSPIGIGMGLTLGPARLGYLGTGPSRSYVAIGRIVTIAARLCDLAEDAQILISGAVHGEIADHARLHEIGPLRLKGVQRPVDAFDLVALSRAKSGSEAA
jgi:class 3 adenylate cyclase